MSKGAYFPRDFWDSPIKGELLRLPPGHLWVFLHLVYGPAAHLSGIYRISVGAISEDTGLTPDEVRAALDDLESIGWCEVEYPLVWIRGLGNILDKLNTTDVRNNPAWVTSTDSHLRDLPSSSRLVQAFRRHHGILGEAGGEAPREAGGVASSNSNSSSRSPSPSPSRPTAPRGGRKRGGSGGSAGRKLGGVIR